jgi:hypothetical protein
VAVSQTLFHFTTDDEVRRTAQFRRDMFGGSGNLDEDTLPVDEDFDANSNCAVVGILERDEIMAVMRVHVLGGDVRTSPAHHVFPEVLGPELDRGFQVVDSSGFCVRSALSRERIDAAYRLLAVSIHIAGRLSPSKMIATARGKHGLFYRHVFGARLACEARAYPGRRHPLSLYIQDTGDLVARLESRGERRFRLDEADRAIVDDALKTVMDRWGEG